MSTDERALIRTILEDELHKAITIGDPFSMHELAQRAAADSPM